MATVPFLPTHREHGLVRSALREALDWFLAAERPAREQAVAEWERLFARFVRAAGAVGVPSGADGLELLLRSRRRRGAGTEVILPAWGPTWLLVAVEAAGFEPVFVDVDEATGLIDVEEARAALNGRTVAVVAAEVDGRQTDWGPLRQHCDRFGILLAVDATGALPRAPESPARRPHALVYDFSPGAPITALHGAGTVVSDDFPTTDALRMATNGGFAAGRRETAGRLAPMSALEARILGAKLATVGRRTEWRRTVVTTYRQRLESWAVLEKLALPPETAQPALHGWTRFTLRFAGDRTALRETAHRNGVTLRTPADQWLPPLAVSGHQRSVERAQRLAQTALELPCHAEMAPQEVEGVLKELDRWIPLTTSGGGNARPAGRPIPRA
jgi:dTDP-4-amino-4,6-dideoxygalactose transaminase